MPRISFILLFLTLSCVAYNQIVFQTILKTGPIAAGESFQVQYVLEDPDDKAEFYMPEFKDFRVINGPYEYDAVGYGPNGPKKMKNYVYTLEALKEGKFQVRGASAKVNDRFLKSDDVWIEVISRKDAAKLRTKFQSEQINPAYILEPGEDPYEKIRDNIFLKVSVNKKSCFVGEPVTATFKLYSCLESQSDIVKNPGFYGFTVQDMIGLNDNLSGIETVGGKKYDVHTVRKVQLYPLSAGEFSIDPMEVTNSVEFSSSVVNKKVEQEIVEGVFPHPSPENKATKRYESNMSSKSISITVKPHPARNRPADFAGATGNFSIRASLSKKILAKNEEGGLRVSISGVGNFTQMGAPEIHWPDGVEGFEPKITDELDHTQAPLKGTRTFVFSFVSAKPGQYRMPAISFSFFDPDSNNYKTVSAPVESLTVTSEEKAVNKLISPEESPVRRNVMVIMAAGLLALSALVAFWLLRMKKKRKRSEKQEVKEETAFPATDELLQPATALLDADDKTFYTALRSCIWNFFSLHFGLKGSQMSRTYLQMVMDKKQVDKSQQQDILDILQQCETGMFTGVQMDADRVEIIKKVKKVLNKLG